MTRKPIEMLLGILANGGRVEEDGYVYAMAESGSLCVVMHDENDNELLVEIDCDLVAFKRMADSIGRDKLWEQYSGYENNH